jgi:hypothetical protein
MDDIFISYKREDRDRARLLARALESKGWSVWWDLNLRAGEHFDKVIGKALEDAKCVIVLWSSRSIQSQYVIDEASYALKLHKLVPVLLDDTEVPFRFQGLHMIQLKEWDGSDTLPFQRLISDIAAMFPQIPAGKEIVAEELPQKSSWRAELVRRERWNILLRIFLDQQSHSLAYTRSLTDESIMLDEENILSKFSLPVSNDASSTHAFEIPDGIGRYPATIRVNLRHMTITEFQLIIEGKIVYSYGEGASNG